MEYKYEYICQMKQPVLCELCNKSYALGVMKKHRECVWFGTTNKPPGRRNTMILGILNMHLCLFMFLHYT